MTKLLYIIEPEETKVYIPNTSFLSYKGVFT